MSQRVSLPLKKRRGMSSEDSLPLEKNAVICLRRDVLRGFLCSWKKRRDMSSRDFSALEKTP
jgi:hypothetical protein